MPTAGSNRERILMAMAGDNVGDLPTDAGNNIDNLLVRIAKGGASAGMIADAYDATSTYSSGDLCTHDGKLYKANQAISTAEEWDETHWTETDIATELADVADPEAIAEAVGDWLGDHVDPETGYVVDDSLSVEGAAADAKATGEAVSDLLSAISVLEPTATSGDVGKFLKAKTVADGKVTAYEFGSGGSGGGGAVDDVRINSVSIVDGNGVANIPKATTSNLGVVKMAAATFGLDINNNGELSVFGAKSADIKSDNTNNYKPIASSAYIATAFYGLAKAAGDSTQSASANSVGTYTETAKSKISDMLSAPETVSGSTPTIVAKAGIKYVCGEVSTLNFTPSATGICDVVFTSGSTPAVLTLPTGADKIKWANGWDETCEADTIYELNVMNGNLGVVAAWS